MVPESTVQLACVASNDNSADMVSKMFYNPFDQTNSNLFHLGPPCFRENDGVKHVFLEMTKCTEKYYPLPDDILRGERKKAEELVEAGPQESFGNKEEERLQGLRCQRYETSCGTVMLVRTCSKSAKLRGNQSGC